MLPDKGNLDVLAENTAGVASEILLFSTLASLFVADVCPLLSSIFWDC